VAITFYDEVSNPADNGTYTTSPAVVTPPSGMQAGDLVVLQACMATTSGSISMSQAGGQTWNSLTQRNTSRNRARVFWCRFNGTWTANPSVTLSSGANNIIRMMVWRPTGGTLSTWAVDVAEVSNTYSAPSDPWTVTINEIVTNYDNSLVIALWSSADDNTWGSLTGGWTALDPVQVRNTSGTYDQSVTAAWLVKEFHGATGNVSQNQATLGGDAGTYYIIAFREIEQHSGASAVTGKGLVTALGIMFIGSLVAISAGPGHIVVTGTAQGSLNPIVKVINETLQRPSYDLSGASAVSGKGSVVGSGQKSGSAPGTVTAGGSVAAMGKKSGSAPNTATAGGSVAATGKKGGLAPSAVSGAGVVVASGASNGQAATNVSANGAVTASGYRGGQSAASVTAAGVVSGAGSKGGAGGTAVSGAGSVVATGEKTQANAIVKVINETLQRPTVYSEASMVTGDGSVVASGAKQGGGASAVSGKGAVAATGTSFIVNPIVKVINETLQRYAEGTQIVKVINETLSPPPHTVAGSSPAPISGGGSVVVSGQRSGNLVKVINESVNATEGSFFTSQDIVQVINEPVQTIEAITTRPALGSASVSGSGSLSAQVKKQVGGTAAISGRGETNVEYKLHARPVGISGGGSLVTTETSAHEVIASISGGGRVVVWRPTPVRSTYKKSFTRIRTGDPKMDRALQLIEEEFSRMIDYVNRKTG
jgi:hypothetical protein